QSVSIAGPVLQGPFYYPSGNLVRRKSSTRLLSWRSAKAPRGCNMKSSNQTRSPRRTSVTKWSLAALIAGIGFGLFRQFYGAEVFSTVGAIAKPIGDVWISALRMLSLPLALVLTLSAIVGSKAKVVGALGTRAVVLFVVLLITAGLFTLTV